MDSTLNNLSLTEVSVNRNKIDSKERYSFYLYIKYGHNYFAANYYLNDRIVSFNCEDVPDTVWEEIADMARAAGDLGVPDSSPPAPSYPPGVLLATPFRETWYCGLTWSDGTNTGMGTAKDQIMKYLYGLAEKCVDAAAKEGPLDEGTTVSIQEKWLCPTCGYDDNLTNYCGGCGIMRPKETWKNAAYFARVEWTCPACGFAGNRNPFCADCGGQKPD